jgi:hypothetical protein
VIAGQDNVMVYAKLLTNAHRAGAASALALVLTACPQGDPGQCSVDADCLGRAQVCDAFNAICIDEEVDLSSTEDPAPMSFSNKAVPFFRGEVCTTHEVQSGERIPVSVSPCLHPCIARGSHHFKHFFNCLGSTCDAYVVMWVTGSSVEDGCPADAFGQFPETECVYGDPIDLGIATQLDSGPISGTMQLEIPYLSNEDIEEIDGGRDSNDQMRALIEQYPQDAGRVVGGRTISILPGNPAPPESCDGGGCNCSSIGF